MNISSVVVQTRPEHINEVVQALQESDACDYHFHDELGRVIVTIEGDDVSEEIAKLTTIQKIPHVAAADMQFAFSEDELNEERDKLDKEGGDIPVWLNDPNANLKDIQYNGDLRKKVLS